VIVALGWIATGCGADGRDSRSPANEPISGGRVVTNAEAGVTFELNGATLRIEVASDAPPSTRDLLEGEVNVFCGTKDELGPYLPSARATTPHLRGPGNVSEVTLNRDIEAEAAFCGVEAREESGEVFGFFVPPEELVGGG
jgi:hypothetical protein